MRHMLPLIVLLLTCSAFCVESKLNELTEEEKAAGWKLLFDGKTTSGFRNLSKTTFPEKGWVVEDGCLRHVAKGGGGDIITNEAYENFELTLEFKVAPASNSGIKYRVADVGGSAFGPEYQVADDGKNPDAKNAKRSAGSLYDVIAPAENKTMKPVGEFNTVKLLVQGNHCEHWLNGQKVVEYEFFSDAWKAGVAASKFAKNPKYAQQAKGHIALQDHGDDVWYRNIKIRELPAK